MTASSPCEPTLPAGFREGLETGVPREGKTREEEEEGEKGTGGTDELASLFKSNKEGKAESESTDDLSSLVTTAAATWCLHALSLQETDALLGMFQQLLRTHHTVYDPTPPAFTDQSVDLPPFSLESAGTTSDKRRHHRTERSTKREDADAQAVAAEAAALAAAAAVESQLDCGMDQPVIQERCRTRGSEDELETASMWTPSASNPLEDSSIKLVHAADTQEASEAQEDDKDTIPYFPLLEGILQGSWTDEGAKKGKRTRKKKKGKRSDVLFPDGTLIDPTGEVPEESAPLEEDTSAQHFSFVHDAVQQSHASEGNGWLPTSSRAVNSLVSTGRNPLQVTSSDHEPHHAAAPCSAENPEEPRPDTQRQDAVCASKSDGATAATVTSQWKFTFTCRICGRDATFEEKSACCGTCLFAQNMQQAQTDAQHTIKKFSSSEKVCSFCGSGREASCAAPASSIDTNNNVDHGNTIPSRETVKSNTKTSGCSKQSSLHVSSGDDSRRVDSNTMLYNPEELEHMSLNVVSSAEEECFLSNLLLPPAVPVSSALKRTSPDAVRLWRQRARRRNVLHQKAYLGEECLSCGNTIEKAATSDKYSSHIGSEMLYATPCSCHQNAKKGEDSPCNGYDDCAEVFDLLKMIQPRKSSAKRMNRMKEEDIHVRAQLACLVDAHEDPIHGAIEKSLERDTATRRKATPLSVGKSTDKVAESAQGDTVAAKRPEAEQLVSAVVNALKRLPKQEREEGAFFELLLAWYYAGFFTGRLSMCTRS